MLSVVVFVFNRLQKELVKYQSRPEENKVKQMEDSLRSELKKAKAELGRISELQAALSDLQTKMARVQGSSDAEIATLKAEKERLTKELYHSEGRYLINLFPDQIGCGLS